MGNSSKRILKSTEQKVRIIDINNFTLEEYASDMKKLLKEKGLHNAVEGICDRTNTVSSVLRYPAHREIQELMCDILYLIELSEANKE